MGRTPRCIISGQPHEVTMRVKEGLPFVCREFMSLLLKGAVARAQRDSKVTLCHLVAMSNHFHIVCIPKDAYQLISFYKEVKKSLTDSLKRLCGRKYLSLWERSTVICLGDKEAVIERISYLYANPCAAHLVESISEYPGVSSWREFVHAPHRLNVRIAEECFWINADTIPALEGEKLSSRQEQALVELLLARATTRHLLEYEPYAWMSCLEMGADEIGEVAEQIHQQVRAREEAARQERAREGRTVVGQQRLRREMPKLDGYLPKKNERKIFVICRNCEHRKWLIKKFQDVFAQCRECYRLWRDYGVVSLWPPGTFRPALSRVEVTALAF